MNERVRKFFLRVIVPIIVLIGVFVLPSFKISSDIYWPLTVSSLVFAILVGFFIATATANYITFRDCLSQEATSLATIFNLIKILSPSEAEKAAEKIDQYAIATLDFSLTDYVEKTDREFRDVIDSVDEITINKSDERVPIIFDHLQGTKIELLRNRESIALSALRVTTGVHWFVLTALASVIIFLLLSLRTDEIALNLVLSILSSAIYFILLLLYEIDGNSFLEEQLEYQDIQKVFKAIDRLPYYPSLALERGQVKKPLENFRLGVYTNYPYSRKKEIKIYKSNE